MGSAAEFANDEVFRIWKWRILRRRREFFLPLLALLSLFTWICLSVAVTRHALESPVAGVIFACAQASILFVVAMFVTVRSKILFRGAIGVKCAALILVSIFPLLYSIKHLTSMGIYFSPDSGSTAAAFLTTAWLAAFHHVGLSDRVSWTTSVAMILFWTLYFVDKDSGVNMVTFAAIIVCCVEVAFVNSLLDAEYFDLYRDQNEVVGIKLNDVSYINDVGITLEDVDKQLEDLQVRFYMATSAPASPSADKSLALNSVSKLQYVHYLCKSLWGAAAADPRDASRDMHMTEVGCSELCAEVFGMIESILRRRCPLYFDQKQLGDLSVRTKTGFLKLVLILLTEECMITNSFCLFSFEKIGGNLQIVIRRISAGSDNSGSEGVENDSLTSGLGPLLPERRPVELANKTARYRLADRIARKHLGSRVDVSEVEAKFGVLQSQIRLTLRGPVSMLSAAGPHSSRSHKLDALCPWYVIEYHRSSDDKLRDVKLQLDVLGVPWKAVHAYHIGSIRVKAQVAVVHETWFKTHHENVFKEV
jgi:hypothetical protein